MFEASVDGQPYDGERWAKYFKPFGYDDKSTTNETYAAIPELVAACKVEQWYRKSTAQFSEFDDQGELKEPDAIFDHLLSPANTGFHANILDIQNTAFDLFPMIKIHARKSLFLSLTL